ncbi:MAG TPA: DNA repair protein RecO [Candidatus Dormibacteraeota bacterium]|nr:DNA repair protein RecO [Candidatus Dormibacteraeota bacterium]
MSEASHTYKAQVIVLRARPLGEADRIVRLFTREFGKLDAVAKGARRPKSRFGGRLELGERAALVLHRGRSLDVISAVESHGSRWNRLVEPERLAVASLAIERIDVLCEPSLALPEIFDLLDATLDAVASSDRPFRYVARYSLRLLDLLGSMPPATRCCACSDELEERSWLDASEGGLLDEKCRRPHRDEIQFDVQDRANFAALGRARGAGAAVEARPHVAAAIEALIAHYCARPLRVSALPGYAFGSP